MKSSLDLDLRGVVCHGVSAAVGDSAADVHSVPGGIGCRCGRGCGMSVPFVP